MFASIAPYYDLLNRVLSLGIDRWWRRRAVNLLGWEGMPDGVFLDACAGTLDVAVELARREGFRGRVIGSDFVPEMLQLGTAKLDGLRVAPLAADALRLPFADACFDGATVAFGVRNLADLDAGLREVARTLRPGARLVILEFTTPRWQPFRATYLFYFRQVLPRVGKLISQHGTAYTYLPESVLRFPEPPQLAERMQAAGFTEVRWETMSGGIVALHTGVRA